MFQDTIWEPIRVQKMFAVLKKNLRHCETYLVGGLEHVLFFHILGIVIPTDNLIFFRGVGQPPTSKDLKLFDARPVVTISGFIQTGTRSITSWRVRHCECSRSDRPKKSFNPWKTMTPNEKRWTRRKWLLRVLDDLPSTMDPRWSRDFPGSSQLYSKYLRCVKIVGQWSDLGSLDLRI